VEKALAPSNIAGVRQVEILNLQTESSPESAIDSGPLSLQRWPQQILCPSSVAIRQAASQRLPTSSLALAADTTKPVNSIRVSYIYR
jgi:hypothetical protein